METALPGRRRKEVCYVYQKLTRTLAPRIGFYFAVMLAFAGVTALLGQHQAAVAELVVVAALFLGYLASGLRRQREAAQYLKELLSSMDQATRDSTLNCPLPLVMFQPDTDEVVWSNGAELSRQFVEELRTTAVEQVVEYGTAKPKPKPSETKQDPDGILAEHGETGGGIANVSENADGSGTLTLKDGTVLN